MDAPTSITKPISTSEQLAESIQQSLLDNGVNKARVTLELLGRKTGDPRDAASGLGPTKPDKNDVEVIILNHVEQEGKERDMGSPDVEKESNCNPNAFMYSSKVIGIDKDQTFIQHTEIVNASPVCVSDSVEASKASGEKEWTPEQTEHDSTGQLLMSMSLSGQNEKPVPGKRKEQHNVMMLPNLAQSEQEGETEGEQLAAAADDPMMVETLDMIMNDDFLPDDIKKMMEREKNKKERIKILNSFVGKSVLLDYKKAQNQEKSSVPPVFSKPFMEAAVHAQMKRGSSAGKRQAPEEGLVTGSRPPTGVSSRSPNASASGIQVLRFTLPAEDQARLDAVEQLRGSASGEQHISAKDKYRLMMDDQQQILKRNDALNGEYKQLLDKAIECNRYFLQ